MTEEIWKDSPGYEGRYQASTLGRIRSVERKVWSRNHYTGEPFERIIPGVILRPGRFCKAGHVSVILGRGTPGKPVHQLIMRTFVGEPPEGMEVLHNNGNPTDNRLVNLRYGTRTENILDTYKNGGRWRKLSINDVEGIRFGLATGMTCTELAAMYGVSVSTVSGIKKGDHYSWLK